MILILVAYLGGVLTLLSPCILPVLPFVFARSGQPFAKSTLPLLIGMALTFAALATLAAVGGGWAVHLNAYGRVLALVLLTAFGVALLSKRVADALAQPFVALGNRLMQSSGGESGSARSFLLGVATGFLWAPCAGPILGLILTGAAIAGPNPQTALLLSAYALGAVTSLALAVFAGNRVLAALKRSFNTGEWLRRGLGVAVLAGVAAIASGLDTGLLTRLSSSGTNRIEQALLDRLGADTNSAAPAMATTNNNMSDTSTQARGENAGAGDALPVEGEMPALDGAAAWLNSPPLTREALRGKVVLIDFWTYSCINCLRSLPYVKTWAQRYKDHGLVVIGVHTPEFAFEKSEDNVRRAVRDLGVEYPVALDNHYAIWQAFNNRYWPAHYFIDAEGRIRAHHFGEGEYDQSEQWIRQLLTEAGHGPLPPVAASMPARGAQAAADLGAVQSPETYVGYARAENFGAGELARDRAADYRAPATLALNHWALQGNWTVAEEYAVLNEAPGKIIYRFHARDLHLVLGPARDGKPVRFRVSIDGVAPGADHGMDVDADGNGEIREQRLYQLIRQAGAVRDRGFTIEFLDAGAHAFAFTFG